MIQTKTQPKQMHPSDIAWTRHTHLSNRQRQIKYWIEGLHLTHSAAESYGDSAAQYAAELKRNRWSGKGEPDVEAIAAVLTAYQDAVTSYATRLFTEGADLIGRDRQELPLFKVGCRDDSEVEVCVYLTKDGRLHLFDTNFHWINGRLIYSPRDSVTLADTVAKTCLAINGAEISGQPLERDPRRLASQISYAIYENLGGLLARQFVEPSRN
jgi:hypothetical protein